MNEPQLGFGRQLLLDAEGGALTHKVVIVATPWPKPPATPTVQPWPLCRL